MVSICANLVNLQPQSGVGPANTRADQHEYVAFGVVTSGSSYLLIVTLPTSRAAVACAVAVFLGTAGLGTFAGAAPSPRPSLIVTERAVVSAPGYWTRARIADVSGVSGLPWAGGGAVARTTGRVFFTMAGIAYSCSGSVVDSKHQDVVITAAHCVSDGAGHWATHWTFVPGYTDGREPYGSYPARTYYVPAQWSGGANED